MGDFVVEPERPVPDGFVHIQGGTFTMGSPDTEAERYSDNEGPQHQVTVSGFLMGKYEVTQKEWVEIMGSNPSRYKGDNLPVENVTWYDAVHYCNARSRKEGLTPAYTIRRENVSWNRNALDQRSLDQRYNGYRLPTEAEWEYACRAGTTGPFSTGDTITTDQANYDGNYSYNNTPEGTIQCTTTAVGSFAPNAWGLYDMNGNVWEWCWDWYGDYSSGSETDPLGASSGSYRVSRGGSCNNDAASLRSAYRSCDTPSYHGYILGFRVVRTRSI